MWKLYKNINSFQDLIKISPSTYYSKPRLLKNIVGSTTIETNNSFVNIHTDEFWLDTPPAKLYLHCEKSSDGGEILLGNFTEVGYSTELIESLNNLKFSFKRKEKEYNYRLLNNSIFKLSHDHKTMFQQLEKYEDKKLLHYYLEVLKKNTDIIKLEPNYGLVINNHLCFHGRLNFETGYEIIKVLGYE